MRRKSPFGPFSPPPDLALRGRCNACGAGLNGSATIADEKRTGEVPAPSSRPLGRPTVPVAQQRTARFDVPVDARLQAWLSASAGDRARPGRWLADHLEAELARRPDVEQCLPRPGLLERALGVGRAFNRAVRTAHERGGRGGVERTLRAGLPDVQGAWAEVGQSIVLRPEVPLSEPGARLGRISLRLPTARRDRVFAALAPYPWRRPRLLWALALGLAWPAPSAANEAALQIARALNNVRQAEDYGVSIDAAVAVLLEARERLLRPVSRGTPA